MLCTTDEAAAAAAAAAPCCIVLYVCVPVNVCKVCAMKCGNAAARLLALFAWPVYAQDAAAALQLVQQAGRTAAASLQLQLQLLYRDGAQLKVSLKLQLQQQPL
jgi:hypothetical protein